MSGVRDGDDLVFPLGVGVEVDATRLQQMEPSEIGLLIARAMAASKRPDVSVPSMRIVAEDGARRRHRASTGTREPVQAWDHVDLAQRLSDGFAWLLSRGLVGPASQNSGSSGEYRLTTAGRELAESGDSGPAEAAYRLHADLHLSLAEARLLFERGSYQTAVFAATHQVEVRVRELSGAGPETYGVQLMRDALHPERGALATGEVASERESFVALFAGTIGAFKNPASHRAVMFDDPTEAADIIHLADLLLRIAERTAAKRDS